MCTNRLDNGDVAFVIVIRNNAREVLWNAIRTFGDFKDLRNKLIGENNKSGMSEDNEEKDIILCLVHCFLL